MELPQFISLILSTVGEVTSPSSVAYIVGVLFCITITASAATSKNRAAVQKAGLNTIFNIILLCIKKDKYSPVDVVGLGLQEAHESQDEQDKKDKKSTAKVIPFIKTKNRHQSSFSGNNDGKDFNATTT